MSKYFSSVLNTTTHAWDFRPGVPFNILYRFAANGSSEAGSARKLVSVRLELGGSIKYC